MKKIVSVTLSILIGYTPAVLAAWDKAEGMRRHGSDKGNGPIIVMSLVFGLPLLYFIYSLVRSALEKEGTKKHHK